MRSILIDGGFSSIGVLLFAAGGVGLGWLYLKSLFLPMLRNSPDVPRPTSFVPWIVIVGFVLASFAPIAYFLGFHYPGKIVRIDISESGNWTFVDPYLREVGAIPASTPRSVTIRTVKELADPDGQYSSGFSHVFSCSPGGEKVFRFEFFETPSSLSASASFRNRLGYPLEWSFIRGRKGPDGETLFATHTWNANGPVFAESEAGEGNH